VGPAVTAPVMGEDELVTGLLEAFALAGWHAFHVRRSDRALLMGRAGWPDITAIRPDGRLLVIEAKSATGRVSEAQGRWLVLLHRAGVTAAVIRPADYDRAIHLILAGESRQVAWDWAFRP